jgi:type IV secretory pathway TraG/TraD family ATPase VirD4
VRSRQTLYLLSKDGGGSAAPLVAALTDRVLRAAVSAAEAGGRLDPPLVAVLDEAANICRIGDLPALYSHLGSRGVIPVTILQSYAQGVGVWGESGTKTLWSAATVKLIGSGMDDASFAEDVSRLVGEHDVPTASYSHGDGRATRTRRERILSAAEIRALPKGTALLLSTGARPALIRTLPWYTGPRAEAINAAIGRAVAGIATAPSFEEESRR